MRRDVDQKVGLGEAQVQHRPERLAAGEHLGKAVRLTEQCGGLGKRGGTFIVEGDGLHVGDRPCHIVGRALGQDGLDDAPRRDRRHAELGAELGERVVDGVGDGGAGGAIAPPSPRPFWPKRV